MAAEIQQLADLISSSVTTLLQACTENGTPFPDPNEPFTPHSEAFRTNQAAAHATNVIAAAAMQLAERVLPPHMAVLNIGAGHFKCAALRSVLELNVTEILREAGPEGLHVKSIAKKCGIDDNRLGRLLRILSLNQCYREVTPNVFANTRISSMMDTGKLAVEIQEKPESKHEGTPGFAALLEHLIGDGAKFSAQLLEHLTDPATAHSIEPTHAPFNRVFQVNLPICEWYETPEQSYRRQRFAISMHGIAQMQPPNILDDILDWKALPEDSIVVDVGGGIGTSSLAVERNHKHLKFIVQDFPNVCEEAKIQWSKEYPEVIDSGRLTFMPNDFFAAQPVPNASVFILKQILHGWADPYCIKILQALRAVAQPDTQLIVIEIILAYACHVPTANSQISTADFKEASAPLLSNYGAANFMPYVIDVGMMLWVNSQERTLGQFDALLRSAGWQLVKARRHDPPSNLCESLLAIPM